MLPSHPAAPRADDADDDAAALVGGRRRHRRRIGLIALALTLAGAAVVLVAVGSGRPDLDPVAAWRTLLDAGAPDNAAVTARVPRALLGLTAGAGLALAGVLLQDALRNPVAGPELLGVSAGAAVVAATATVLRLGWGGPVLLAASFAGAVLCGAVVIAAMGGGGSPERTIVVGAAVSSAAGGLVVAVIGLGTEGDVLLLLRYLLGSLAARGEQDLIVVTAVVVPATVAAFALARSVSALRLGDAAATALGVPVLRTRVLALVLAALPVAAICAACGPIAWIALLAPHLARALAGATDTRTTLLLALPIGALLLTLADLVARTALEPVEIPVGVVTTLIGVPATAAVLLLRRAR